MKRVLVVFFTSIAFILSAKVVTLYYGPYSDDKYLEIIMHGDEAIVYVQDTVLTYSHSRVEYMMKEPRLWRLKYVGFNESDSTLVFHNTFHKPVRKRFAISNDLSTLEIVDMRPDTIIPAEKLQLVNIHIDPRAGEADFIGNPDLKIQSSALQ